VAGHLLVTNDFPPKTGGIQVYLYELWRRLEPGRAVVLTARSHPDAEAFDRSSAMVIERVDAATLFAPTWRARAAIEAAIARHQPDLVLLDPAWPLGLLGPTLSRPYGVVLHGAEVTVPGRLPVVASSLRAVLRHARVAVCAGGYPEAEARRNAGDAMCPVVRVAPGVDVDRFHPLPEDRRLEVRRELGLSERGPLVSSYSRLVPRKGMDTLIRASAEVARHVGDLTVAIGGAGRDRARLERLARSTSAPVTFLGRVPDDVLPAWLAASDLMVMDCRSRWAGLEQEGFGIVFVEAAAAGVAAIAGRSGGSHEAVRDGETGLVVDHPRRVRDLAAAMTSLLRDGDQRAAYGARAREVAEASFRWDELARQLGEGLAPYDGVGTRESAS
jgi:phosphatidylinositol alpha-1,6-mannosyltransferase